MTEACTDCPGTYPPGPGQSLFLGVTVGSVQLPRGATGFEVLAADALDTAVSRADLSLLDAAEQRQIRHCRPATVGEILFNYWD
jgi:hypothetical protein